MYSLVGVGLGGFATYSLILQPSDSLQAQHIAHSTPAGNGRRTWRDRRNPSFLIVLLPWSVCLRGALTRRPSRRYLPAAAFATAAVSIFLHSLVYFSLQIPAIGFVTTAARLELLGTRHSVGETRRNPG